MPKPGEIEFSTATPEMRVVAKLGQALPQITAGYGGWQLVERPRRQSLTQWQGREPLQLAVQIILDKFRVRQELTGPQFQFVSESVELEISKLERMALPPANGKEPPVVRCNGDVPYGDPDLDWIIESLEWGACIRAAAGRRVRQEATVVMRRYVEPVFVKLGNAAEARRQASLSKTISRKKKKSTNRTTMAYVQNDDTLITIAVREYGDPTLWREIADANDIRDPKSVVPGQRIRLP